MSLNRVACRANLAWCGGSADATLGMVGIDREEMQVTGGGGATVVNSSSALTALTAFSCVASLDCDHSGGVRVRESVE